MSHNTLISDFDNNLWLVYSKKYLKYGITLKLVVINKYNNVMFIKQLLSIN